MLSSILGNDMKKLSKIVVILSLLLFVGCASNNDNENNLQTNLPTDEVAIDIGEIMNNILVNNFAEGSFIDYDDEYIGKTLKIDHNLIKAYIGKYPMITFEATEIGMFEVENENLNEVIDNLEKYKEDKMNNASIETEKKAAQNAIIYHKGNYIFLIMCENADDILAQIKNMI